MLFDLFFLLQFGSVFFVENIKMKDTDIYIRIWFYLSLNFAVCT